ncbi:MAG: ATP-binding protein [Syntrophobacteraceae bacterium]
MLKEKLLINSMQVKLMLLFFVFALAPLCALGMISIRTAEELILNMATNQIQQVAVDKAALLERWISERKADIEVIAGSSILRSLDSEQIAPYLELVRSKYKVYGEISVLTPEGKTICRTSGSESGFETMDLPTSPELGRMYMSDIRLSNDRKESYFSISAPLVGKSSERQGVVSASVGTRTILSVVLRVSLGKTGECYLVNRDGTFLAHKEPERILSENIAQSESFKNVFGVQNRRITYIDYRGIEVIGASMLIGGTDWALVVEQDRDEVFRDANELRSCIFLVISLSVIGALISAWLLARYVATPIRRLAKAANELAMGDFEAVHIEHTDRNDEVGLLYDAFAEMAGQLKDRQNKLEERVILSEAELKETDVKLKQTEEAAARSQQLASLGRLAAGVAHEIRTPLTSLKMFLQSLETEMEISGEYEEDFQVAMTQIKRMEATINRFLDFARPQDPLFAEVDVRELIENSMLVVGPRAKQQETIIRTRIADSLPLIRGDGKQLEEALLNLMVNGLEAVGFSGELILTAYTESYPVEKELREFIRIDIADTGPGIKEETIPNLFDPFFTTKPTGTGLGLSIVYATLRRHGGRVSVENRAGNGATFSLFIPVQFEGKPGEDGKDSDR